jgi:hypothetical protein
MARRTASQTLRPAPDRQEWSNEARPSASPVRSVAGWWLRPGLSLVWRVPLFLLLGALGMWFVFLGLVHVAFIFDRHPFATFIFAPALLPFAALPALCFLFCLRGVAWAWRNPDFSPGQKNLAAGGGPLVAFLLAELLDAIQVNMIHFIGIHLPRLPLDPY